MQSDRAIAYFSLTPNPETRVPNYMKTQEGNSKLNRTNKELLSDSVLVEAFFISPKLLYRAVALCEGG
jgi:hypothetical protein